MAHNLNFNEKLNRHSFFSVKEKAWHELGIVVDKCPNSAEAIKLAGLDFDVDKSPITATIHSDGREIKDKYATYRTDTKEVFGIVGSKYTPIQNRDAFSFFDSIVGEGAAIYETAGCLNKGETIFITAKLPEYIKVGKNDLIEQYLFLTNTHDGSGAVQAMFTPVRVVCNNTLNIALRSNTNKVMIRHTANAKDRLEAAHKIMGISHKLVLELGDIFNAMARIKITDANLKGLIQYAMVPNKEVFGKLQAKEEVSARFEAMCEEVLVYAHTSPTQQMPTTKGTLFGAYNAITGYYQNVKEYKAPEKKLASIMDGGVAYHSQKAFELCFDYMKDALNN